MDAAALVDRCITAWNERDAEARKAAVAEVWADDGRYVDPLADVTGQGEIADGSEASRPRHQATSSGSSTGPTAITTSCASAGSWCRSRAASRSIGRDVGRTKEDGRFGAVVGFLDQAPVG